MYRSAKYLGAEGGKRWWWVSLFPMKRRLGRGLALQIFKKIFCLELALFWCILTQCCKLHLSSIDSFLSARITCLSPTKNCVVGKRQVVPCKLTVAVAVAAPPSISGCRGWIRTGALSGHSKHNLRRRAELFQWRWSRWRYDKKSIPRSAVPASGVDRLLLLL